MDLQPNHHHHHLQQQQQPASAPPPHSHKPLLDQDFKQELKRRPIVPLSFSNGALKKHRPLYPPAPPPPPHAHNHVVYRECMKNHAASLGGHALDGCGEFMPSPEATPADPASLTCAACGCHRNFHRRVLHGGGDLNHPHREDREVADDGAAEEDDGDEAVDDDEDEEARGSTPPPHAGAAAHQYYSAPHMLMALSAGIPGVPSSAGAGSGSAGAATHATGGSNPASAGGGLQLPRKRFRTKFSSLQKERMQELSERLGWRMQRRDEALVEECCREIGVSRGVFKVWMHNNKHNFVGGPSSRRTSGGAGGGGGVAGIVGLTLGGNGGAGRGEATSSSGGGIGGGGGIAAPINGVEQRNGAGEEQNGGSGGVVGGHGLNISSPSS